MKAIKALLRISLAAAAAVSLHVSAETVEDRLKPAGTLCMAGDPCASAAGATVQVAAAGGAARSGEEVYTSKCATCHATGAAGAPKLGDVALWNDRLGQGLDILYKHAIEGFKAMPAKGLCFDCSDDEIKASVDYILANSK